MARLACVSSGIMPPGDATALRLLVTLALLPPPVADSGDCTVFLLVSKIEHAPAWNALTLFTKQSCNRKLPIPEGLVHA